MVASVWCGGSLLAALALARPAAAFPSTRLVYVRGPGTEDCPDQAAVREAVSTRLGYDPFFPSSDKTIVARVSRRADHLSGQVELVDDHGVQVGLREFSAEPDHCDDLIRAMALSISIAIDPKSAETYGRGPPDEPVESVPAEPEKRGATEPEPARPKEAGVPAHANGAARGASAPLLRPWNASVGIAVLGLWHTEPKLTLGSAAFGALRRGPWSFALEGSADLPVTDQRRGVSIRTRAFALSAVPCFHLGVGFACALGSLRWLNATRTDSGTDNGSQPYWAVGGRIGSELPLSSSFGLLGFVDFQAALRRPTVVAVSEPLWQVPFSSANLGIAAAVHF
jgi:hypothetical protein